MTKLSYKLILLFSVVALTGILAVSYMGLKTFVDEQHNFLSDSTRSEAINISGDVANALDRLENEIRVINRLSKISPHEGAAALKETKAVAGVEVLRDAKNPFVEKIRAAGRRVLTTGGDEDSDLILLTNVPDGVIAARLTREFLKETFENSSSLLVSESGKILLKGGVQDPIVNDELLSTLKDREHLIAAGKVIRNKNGNNVYATVAPVRDTVGAAVITENPASLVAPVIKIFAKNSAPAILGVLILSVVIAALFSMNLVKPIVELTRAAARVGTGHWVVQVENTSRDEIGRLVTAFTNMGTELAHREAELQKAQDDLIRTEKLATLGKFSAGIAHEVKNPLNTILGYAQLLDMQVKEDAGSSMKKYLKFIMDETWRANRIISDLLSFSRQKPPQLSPVKLDEYINYIFEMNLPVAAKSNVKFTKESAGASMTVQLDRDQMTQVFSNLVTNAFQALEDKSSGEKQVSLATRSQPGWAVIEIKDNGPGISKENLSRLFEPFFTTKKIGKGTGLGLSLCYGIVQQHRGRIEVASEPSVGTTFSIWLPVPDSRTANS